MRTQQFLSIACLAVLLLAGSAQAALSVPPTDELDCYNVIWTTQSKNSGESMPVSGGDVGVHGKRI